MGSSTYITLRKPGPLHLDKELSMSFDTDILYLHNYALGKVYFNDLPDVEIDIWFHPYVDTEGEFTIEEFLKLLYYLRENKMQPHESKNPWYAFSYHDLIEKLEHLVKHERITLKDYIQFSVWL